MKFCTVALPLSLVTRNESHQPIKDENTSKASTPSQITVAQKKKAILTQMWPVLLLVGNTLNAGGTPKDVDIQTLNSFVDQLTALATGGK